VGDRLGLAQGEVEAAGLRLVFEERYSSNVPVNEVISQDPRPGQEVERGSTVRVVVSLGPELVPVPSLSGLPLEQARVRIDRARLEVGRVTRVFDEQVPEGRVVEQNPQSGTDLEVGDSVDLSVSRGPEPVDIPSIVGLPQEQAETLLVGAGLGVRVTEDFSAEVEEGNVISQQPSAGGSVAPDTVVTIVVSKGPQQFPMPNVVGRDAGNAEGELRALGLNVTATQVPGSEGSTVVGQNPDAGTTVEQGDTVRIFVGGLAE
jgi:serine/threonine-protein kinase